MALTHDEVRRIAELAKLDLSDAEVALYATQLSHILDYFERLAALDTSRVSPAAAVLPLRNVFRADQAAPALPPDEVVANAPSAADHQFVVSAVLGDE